MPEEKKPKNESTDSKIKGRKDMVVDDPADNTEKADEDKKSQASGRRIKIEPINISSKNDTKNEENTGDEDKTEAGNKLTEEKTEPATSSDSDDKKTESKSGSDESAEVDALASTTNSKAKQSKKEAEEEAKRKDKINSLIQGQKYFLPISESARSRKNTRLLILFLIVIVLVSYNFLLDAEILNGPIVPPTNLL